MPQDFPIVVVGAGSLIAPYLLRRLYESGMTAEVISRKPVAVPEGFTLTRMDITSARNWIAPEGAVVISFLPRWLLIQFMPRFIGVKAMIAVSSTIIFSSTASVSVEERKIAQDLEQAEGLLRDWCQRSLVKHTLLRPTMIYDGQNDNNVARMVRFIRRFHFLPLASPAKGLRQPIHADDVARAVMAAINNEAAYDQSFNIAGSEVLTYRAIVERIFAAMGRDPRLLMLPTERLMKLFHIGEHIGLLREKSFASTAFQRMNEDLIFDVGEGLRVLDYQPRAFSPDISYAC